MNGTVQLVMYFSFPNPKFYIVEPPSESRESFDIAISRIIQLFQNFEIIMKNAHYFCLKFEMRADDTEKAIK